jgi:hypothetical protein
MAVNAGWSESTMSRFPELKGLSVLIKVSVFLVIAAGLLIALFEDTGWARLGGLVISLLIALAYWIQARFVDILLQINGTTMETLTDVRSLLAEHRQAATAAVAAAPRVAAPPSAPGSSSADPVAPVGAVRGRVGARLAIEMSAATAKPGGAVTVWVAGAAPASSLEVRLRDGDGTVRSKISTWTNGDGAARVGMSVPADLPSGTYEVVASTVSDSAAAVLTVGA